MQQNVTWAPHSIMTSSSGQGQEEERSGQNRHQGEEMLAGGGLRDAETFLLPDPVLLPGGPGAPMLSLGSPGILSCPGQREDKPSESIWGWTSVDTGAWSPSGLPWFTGGARVESGCPLHTRVALYTVQWPPSGKCRSARIGSQAGMLAPGCRCRVQVAHLWEGPGEQRDSVGGKGPGEVLASSDTSSICVIPVSDCKPRTGRQSVSWREGTEPGRKAGRLMPSLVLKQWLGGSGPAQPANWVHQGAGGEMTLGPRPPSRSPEIELRATRLTVAPRHWCGGAPSLGQGSRGGKGSKCSDMQLFPGDTWALGPVLGKPAVLTSDSLAGQNCRWLMTLLEPLLQASFRGRLFQGS